MHVVQSLEVGGLENGVVNLLNRLNGESFEHVICCLSRSGRLAERIRAKNVDIVEVGLRTDRLRFPVLTLRKHIRKFAPDILHTRGWSTVDAIFAGALAGVPRIVHGEHGREASDPEGRNRKRNLIRRALSPLVDQFITVSEDLRDWLINDVGIPALKVATIHNGVDTERFAPERKKQDVSGARNALRASLDVPIDAILIGAVGRLDPVKDHRALIQAFAPLSHADLPARLVIVGEGPMRTVLEAEISALRLTERVRLLGERQDIPELLKTLDIFVLPSMAEGISNTLLEAMASGLPVIATRVGGNPELVEHGKNGWLVRTGDTSELTQALKTYVADAALRRLHGSCGRQRAEQYFSLDRMAAGYAEIYYSLTGHTAHATFLGRNAWQNAQGEFHRDGGERQGQR